MVGTVSGRDPDSWSIVNTWRKSSAKHDGDEAAIRNSVREILDDEGYEVMIAADGNEALLRKPFSLDELLAKVDKILQDPAL